ncbi:3'-5' exonuclease [Nonomuraea rhizosphaerae]|uniref:3'-5' exonuclease n=1 Tax=Nonomuraea rhizosphaerae TaxID=2665663 RepID=UPI001C5F6A5E|nr:3'-5' exonuclease [Nonomuraea rhizosphaerae]
MPDQPWTTAPIVTVDMVGTGAQDGHDERILEVATVPLVNGRPDMSDAWSVTLNPGRPVAPRPAQPASPEATDAPLLEEVAGELTRRLDGRIIAGHNVAVDWRLLHHRLPAITPVALIDTTRLVRLLLPDARRGNLAHLVDRYDLAKDLAELAPQAGWRRTLRDATAAALLLGTLAGRLPAGTGTTLEALLRAAGLPLPVEEHTEHVSPAGPDQKPLAP